MKRLFAIILCLPGLFPAPASASPTNNLDRIQSEANQGHLEKAISLANDAILKKPADAELFFFRGRLHAEQESFTNSIFDFTRCLELNPGVPLAHFYRGLAYFQTGQIPPSIRDFDSFSGSFPLRAPHLWQRGISLYYAGEFALARKQFESHARVNPNDVENSAWHFLCVARMEGVESARKNLLPCKDDARPPMMQVLALYAGHGTVKVVEAAANTPPANFYAELYIGLYFEALGNAKESMDWMKRAARDAPPHNYMGDVAKVHVQLKK